jgi:hypothetical protein
MYCPRAIRTTSFRRAASPCMFAIREERDSRIVKRSQNRQATIGRPVIHDDQLPVAGSLGKTLRSAWMRKGALLYTGRPMVSFGSAGKLLFPILFHSAPLGVKIECNTSQSNFFCRRRARCNKSVLPGRNSQDSME